MTAPPSSLHQLAERMGIIREYIDQTGTERRVTSDDTRVALLAAMRVDASSDAAASRELDRMDTLARERTLDPVLVVRADATERHLARVRVPGGGAGDRVEWRTELLLEGGDSRTDAGTAIASRDHVDLPIDGNMEPGYHRLRVSVSVGGEARQAEQSLIVTPFRCPDPAESLGGNVFGITANLYTLRSRRNWGAGDLDDLAALAEWSGRIGGGGGGGAHFIGVNPLHALHNRGGDVSPYSPISRLFRNVLYLDIEAIPELAECAPARERISAPSFRSELARLRESETVEYERVMALKRPVLALLHRVFIEKHRNSGSDRGDRFHRYLESQGEALQDFATWMALHEHFESEPWPDSFLLPRSRAVVEFRDANPDAVDFHRYLQFELDRQLASAAARATHAGHRIGIYQDLAIGSAPGGSDVWAFPDLFIRGAAIGAPPDPLYQAGQNWGLPPLDPIQLAHHGYDYWVRLLRASLAHAGALRIDHVMGLFHQFWIPEGMTGREGAYVRFPSSDLLGILALEATRHAAFVVGEDLGTVPAEVSPALAERNILSSRVLYFERDRAGVAFAPARSYPELALATANTHDMTTLAGFWSGRDIGLRQATMRGSASSDAELERALAAREEEKRELVARLVEDGALNPASTPPPIAELCGAVHDFLCRTPSVLVGLSLDDIAGEVDPVNLPGASAEEYPSWTRKMHLAVEDLSSDPGVRVALGGSCANARRLPDG